MTFWDDLTFSMLWLVLLSVVGFLGAVTLGFI